MTHDPQDLLDELDRMENEQPWKPEVGDTLTGTVEWVDTRTSEHDPTCPVVGILDNENQLWAVWGYGTVLRGKLVDLKPRPGDMMAFRRLENGVSLARKQEYKRYLVAHKRTEPAPDFDWDGVDKDGGDVPAAEVKELTHEETVRMLTAQDRERGPRPVEEKKDAPTGLFDDDDGFKAPWETDD